MFDLEHKSSQNQTDIIHLTSLELFAGAGGLALGVHRAGFRHVGLVEINEFAVDTLRENSKRLLDLDSTFVLHSDARYIDYRPLLGKVDLLSGGPPCQPFSTGGHDGGPTDPRNMFPAALSALGAILPKAVLFENVKGLCRKKFANYMDYLKRRIRFPLHTLREGESWEDHYRRLITVRENDFPDCEKYSVSVQIVDTADFGVPQRRERVLFIGFRCDISTDGFYLEPTHGKEALLCDQWITGKYWERHGIERYDNLGTLDRKFVTTLQNSLIPNDDKLPWITVRDVLNDLPIPVQRGQKEEIINHTQHPGARTYPGHTGSNYDYPAKALKAGAHGTPGGENILRIPNENSVRYFTTREAARIQTFPDTWKFHGSWGACIKQLGNAVPVEIIRLFASKIRGRLFQMDRMVGEDNNGCTRAT